MKILVTIILIIMMASSAWAIDGARGLGADVAKLEAGYSGGEVHLIYNYGLSMDWTIYGIYSGFGGVTFFGAGTKYAFLNEKKGDNISFAGKIDFLLGQGGLNPKLGLVCSKKIKRDLTVMGEISAISIKNVSNSWIGAGVVYDLNRKWQLAGMLGIAANKGGSGVDVGIGINYLF